MNTAQLKNIIALYAPSDITICTLGSHSALDICRGAKDESIRTTVICQKGRERTYAHYYKQQDAVGIIDDIMLVDNFADIISAAIQEELLYKNVIFVPHRSLSAYLHANYAAIEQLKIPFFGNRYLLKVEERTGPHAQYNLLAAAHIRTPKRFDDYRHIDRLCIVKLPEKERAFERAFFFCSTPADFQRAIDQKIDSQQINPNKISEAVIEEFIIGPYVNFNFFYSPLSKRLELLGTDTRRQTNNDGFLHLQAAQQLDLKQYPIKFEEAGHIAVSVVESMLETAFEAAEKLVIASQQLYAPGIIGPFALQAAIVPGPPKKDIVVFDISLRMPGSPGISATPYSSYLYGFPVSAGRRVAMEIKKAIRENRLQEVVT
jgi:5-formaminoimidazole-4-carboxamide-1-(beta)-D-ribofuranosyl 5'-monophosphate synthetase